MKRIFIIALLVAVAGCQSSAVSPQGASVVPQAKGGVKPTIWEPPQVTASNGSDKDVSYSVSSMCSPSPYTPTSGTIAAGSAFQIVFKPTGTPCSYESASIQATDGNTSGDDDCSFVVDGYSVLVVNHSNTDCTISPNGSGYDWVYKLISGLRIRGSKQTRTQVLEFI